MEVNEIKNVRIEKRNSMLAKGVNPYGGKYQFEKDVAQVLHEFTEGQAVTLAGRIMANRKHGKVLFLDLQDQSGKIQLYIKEAIIGPERFELVGDLDIGD